MTPAVAPRQAELAEALAAVRQRIAVACGAVGRDPADVTLVAVGKTWPVTDVAHLLALGVLDIGADRAQDMAAKAAELPVLGPAGAGTGAPRWHFIGRLQRNKAALVGSIASLVHSVDRVELLAGLAAGAQRAGHVVDVLVQVSLEPRPDAGRGGALPVAVPVLADAVAAADWLRLAGVMAVAPLGADPARAFARLHAVAERLRAAHPRAGEISAGMSGDLEAAIAQGATLVRVGTALLGRRPAAADLPMG